MPLQELQQLNRRYGKHIRARPLEFADDAEDRMAAAKKWVNSLPRASRRYKRDAAAVGRQQEIADIIREAEQEDTPLTYMDLYGVLALRHGLDELGQYGSALNAMTQRGIVRSEGCGSVRNALTRGIVKHIHGYVQSHSGTFTIHDIESELELPRNEYYRKLSNVSLNLLDMVHEVVKLPVRSDRDGTPCAWIGPDNRHSEQTIPYWNAKYAVLLALRETVRAAKSDLAANKRIAELVFIREAPGGRYTCASIDAALDDLIHTGLVAPGTEWRRRTVRIYAITPEGKRAVDATEEQRYLDEDLRRWLLGERYTGLTPSEMFTLEKVRRVGRIYDSWMKGGNYIARISESTSYANEITTGKRDPLHDMNATTLMGKYFPHLDAREQQGVLFYVHRRT
ncbi:MAG: hypothetical protein HYY37_00475 [Candidatus Aenigmarchaeota archaeon]|nr:hypothetical protein [Candidatus Aenigmarchaeota archaeon]